MSNVQKADPYRRLIKLMIVLLVLFVLLLTGYLLLESYKKGQHEQAQRRIIEENNQMIEAYNNALLAQRSEEVPDAAPAWPQPKAEGIDIVGLKGFGVKGEQRMTVSRAEALTGGLLVINRWHGLPADFATVEGQLDSIMTVTNRRVPTERRELSLFPVAINALDQMITAAKADGLEYFLVRGGYRSMQTQTEYWDKRVNELGASGRLTGDALTEEARKTVAFPGTSDYQSGFSVFLDAYSANDPVLNQAKFQETEQAKWLYQNGPKYGFIFRFPVSGYPYATTVDKSYKTGIDLKDMDVYRYVGVPHALVMEQKGFCLEEYIEYLIEQGHIAVYQDGQLIHEIFRVEEGSTQTDFLIPSGSSEVVCSSDNLGGLICAVSY